MSSRFKRELSINVNTNVDTKPIQDAEKIVSGFFDKYDGESIKIGVDTKQAKVDAREFSSMIRQVSVLEEKINKVKVESPSMLPALREDIANLEQFKTELASASAVFNDGSIAIGFEQIMSKLSQEFHIVAVDLGERVQYLKNQISESVNYLNSIGATKITWRGLSFNEGDMNESALYDRIELLKRLISYQKELELFSGKPFTIADAPLESTTNVAESKIKTLEHMLQDLQEYNSKVEEQYKITTEQLKRRQTLIDEVYNFNWGDSTQNDAIQSVKNDTMYEESISQLKAYISDRESLIKQLRSNESELFRADGIDEYISYIEQQVQKYQGYIDALQIAKNNSENAPNVGVNFNGIITQLKEIKDAINDIKNVFEPLTTALSAEDSALHKMLTVSINDLDILSTKLNEIYQMISTISTKQFNVNNIISNGSNQDDLEQIRAFRKEAKSVFNEVQELYNEATITASKIQKMPGGIDEVLNFSNLMSDFDPSDLAKRIKSRSATSLGVVIDELNEWKKVLLQFNMLRNNVEKGSFNVNKYTDTSSKVSIGSKTTDKDEKTIVNETSVDNDDILKKPVRIIGKVIELRGKF